MKYFSKENRITYFNSTEEFSMSRDICSIANGLMVSTLEKENIITIFYLIKNKSQDKLTLKTPLLPFEAWKNSNPSICFKQLFLLPLNCKNVYLIATSIIWCASFPPWLPPSIWDSSTRTLTYHSKLDMYW